MLARRLRLDRLASATHSKNQIDPGLVARVGVVANLPRVAAVGAAIGLPVGRPPHGTDDAP
jgi:hypothetical protein